MWDCTVFQGLFALKLRIFMVTLHAMFYKNDKIAIGIMLNFRTNFSKILPSECLPFVANI